VREGTARELYIKDVVSRIQLRPSSVVLADPANLSEKGVFASAEVDGTLYAVIPSNLESFGDDPQVIACLAAGVAAGAHWIDTMDPVESKHKLDLRSKKGAAQWFLGVASFMRYQEKSPPLATGQWAKGWHWCASICMENSKVQTSWLKTKSGHLTSALTGHAWSKDVSPEQRRLESFLRTAAKRLNYEPDWPSWVKPSASLIGTHIKKAPSFEKEGILTPAEVSVFKDVYGPALDEYKNAYSVLDSGNVTLEQLQELPRRLRETSGGLANASLLTDRIIRTRIAAVTPENKREAKREAKRPMRERLAELDPRDTRSVMGIWVAVNAKFTLPTLDHDLHDDEADDIVRKHAKLFVKRLRLPSDKFAELAIDQLSELLQIGDLQL
jgi:hypothetical protein